MDTILNFMDKIYGDTKALTLVYVVGAVLLLICIVLLVISLRSPVKKNDKSKEKTVDKKQEEQVTETKDEIVVKEEALSQESIKSDEVKVEEEKSDEINLEDKKPNEETNTVEQVLNNIENKQSEPEVPIEDKLSVDIPNVDEYVDNIVKKTYEKNEQFSSVYVDDTQSIKLEKVLDKMNVDENVKEVLTENVDASEKKEEAVQVEEKTMSLDNLKKELEMKKNNNEVKQEDLKSKLEELSNSKNSDTKKEEAMNPEDLLKKLNSMREK